MDEPRSLQGHLLIASPALRDPNFDRTVVLIVRHSEEGAFGLVLNRPTTMTIKQIWEHVDDESSVQDAPVYMGGPVKGPLAALHTDELLSEVEIMPGAYMSAEAGKLGELVARSDDEIRFFIGCSGWGAGQLEGELEEGAWITTPANVSHLFVAVGEDLWEKVLKEISGESILSALKIEAPPEDPSVN